MNIPAIIISDQTIHALGWTLIHSLWQGAAIGLILTAVLTYLRHRNARLRYIAYLGGLVLIFILSLLTFSFISHHQEQVAQVTASQKTVRDPFVNGVLLLIKQGTAEAVSSNLSGIKHSIASVIDFIETNTPVFVVIWFVGMAIFLVKFLGGLAYAHRVKSYKTKPVGEEILKCFSEIKKKINLSRSVRLVESAMVRIPMVVGCLKPVILLPAGVVTGLPMQQIETILVHELVHIYRRDYLINIFQSLMEVLFFFNPVIWWISRSIRIERENICDDMTLAYCGDSLTYAKALASLQDIEEDVAVVATAFTGKKDQLLNRICRIIGKPHFKPAFPEGLIPAVIILAIALTISSSAAISFKPDDKIIKLPLTYNTKKSVIQSPLVGLLPESSSKSGNTDNSGIVSKNQEISRIRTYNAGFIKTDPYSLVLLGEDTAKAAREKAIEEARKAYEEAMEQQNAATKEMQKAHDQQKQAEMEYRKALGEQKHVCIAEYKKLIEDQQKNLRECYRIRRDSLDEECLRILIEPFGTLEELYDIREPVIIISPDSVKRIVKIRHGRNFYNYSDPDTIYSDSLGNYRAEKYSKFFFGCDSLGMDSLNFNYKPYLWGEVLNLPPDIIKELDSLNIYNLDYSGLMPEDFNFDKFNEDWDREHWDREFYYEFPDKEDKDWEIPEQDIRPLPPEYELFEHYSYPGHDFDVLKVKQIIREELILDGLIDEDRNYIIEITAKEMVINGVKQPKSVHTKYKRLLESALGEEVKDGYTYYF
jgi:beta-lactamase regulating signal transducer with metallopeptidase domain